MAFAGCESKFHYILEDYLGAALPETAAMHGIIAEDIEPNIDTALIGVRGCGTRDLAALKRGLLKADLKVVYPLPSDDIMNLLHHVLTCWAFTFEVTDEADGAIVDVLYSGSRIDQATVSCSMDDILRAELDIMSQKVDGFDAIIAGATYTELGGAIPFSACNIEKGDPDGSNLADFTVVTDWKFTIKNNLKRVAVFPSAGTVGGDGMTPKYIKPCQRELTGELTCTFENKDQYYAAAAGAFFIF